VLEGQIRECNTQRDDNMRPFLENTLAKVQMYRNSINYKTTLVKSNSNEHKVKLHKKERFDINSVVCIDSPLLERKMMEFDAYLGGPMKNDRLVMRLVN